VDKPLKWPARGWILLRIRISRFLSSCHEGPDSPDSRLAVDRSPASPPWFPIRRHRARWQITVGGRPVGSRILHGGEYALPVRLMLVAMRGGERPPTSRCAPFSGWA